jgi:4-hydroxy-tetrahydrodipicolinate reductase
VTSPLVVFGITGRMGQTLIRALREGSLFHLSGAVASAGSARRGQDAAAEGQATGVLITADPAAALKSGAVAVDFSLAAAVAAHAAACAQAGVPLLVGATGFDTPTKRELERAAQRIPVLIAPNTSVGVAVLNELAARAAAALGERYEVEISEAHHRLKRDAPSGTALALGEAIVQAAARSADSIVFSVVRAGDIVGEHTVSFTGAGERLELTHRATDRITFARGALRAAAWLVDQPAGLYGMQNVLGL